MKKRPLKVADSDQIELHDEKIVPLVNLSQEDDAVHLDISA